MSKSPSKPKPSLMGFMNKPAAPELAAAQRKTDKPAGEEIVKSSYRCSRSRWKQLRDLATDEKTSFQEIMDRSLKAEFDRLGLTLAD